MFTVTVVYDVLDRIKLWAVIPTDNRPCICIMAFQHHSMAYAQARFMNKRGY